MFRRFVISNSTKPTLPRSNFDLNTSNVLPAKSFKSRTIYHEIHNSNIPITNLQITGIDQPTGPTHSRKGKAISARFLPCENVEHSFCNRHKKKKKKKKSITDEISEYTSIW